MAEAKVERGGEMHGLGNVALGNIMTGPVAAMTGACRDGGGNLLPQGF